MWFLQIDPRHVAVTQFEWCKPGHCTDIAVQRKLYHQAFDFPVLLVIVNDGPQYMID
jgi:hypothetical protein